MRRASCRFPALPPQGWPNPFAPPATSTWCIERPCQRASSICCTKPGAATPFSRSAPAMSIALWANSLCCWTRNVPPGWIMQLTDPEILAAFPGLGVERLPGASLAERTSLGIGGTTDLLLVRRHATIPELVSRLRRAHIPYRFLGGGTNLLVGDGDLPWIVLQLARQDPEVRIEGTFAWVDAAADLGRTVTFCAKRDRSEE